MRRNRPGWRAVAAWLGVVALSLNALFPIRYAFGLAADLANARECGHTQVGAPISDPAWHVLALLTGQDEPADPSSTHKGWHPTFGALSGFAASPSGFSPPAAIALPLPAPADTAIAITIFDHPTQAFPAAYRSRAPPIRTA
jgi:hypothetical protein